MKLAFAVAVFLLAIASAQTYTMPPPINGGTTASPGESACHVCMEIVNIAVHHYNDKHPSEKELKKLLDQECHDLEKHEGKGAVKHCLHVIENYMPELYVDIVDKRMNPHKTCKDIKQC